MKKVVLFALVVTLTGIVFSCTDKTEDTAELYKNQSDEVDLSKIKRPGDGGEEENNG